MSVTDSGESHVQTSPVLYWIGLAVVFFLWLFAGLLLSYQGDVAVGLNSGYLTWIVAAWYFILGIRVINPSKIAGVLVLGKPTIVVSGGLVLVLPGIFKLVDFPRGTIEMELPAEPQDIFRNEDTQEVPKGKRPPNRITFANADFSKDDVDKNDPLNHRVTIEVSTFTRWRIRDFWDFYIRIGSTDEAKRQLEDMSTAMQQERLAKLTLSKTLATLDVINKDLDDHIRTRTSNWGVEMIDASIKLLGFSRSLNTAIQSVSVSKASKQSTILDAEAEERKLTLHGQGTANAVKAELDARTDGMKKMSDDLKVDGKDIVGAETARRIGESPSTKIVLGTQGLSELIGAGATIARNFAQKNP